MDNPVYLNYYQSSYNDPLEFKAPYLPAFFVLFCFFASLLPTLKKKKNWDILIPRISELASAPP